MKAKEANRKLKEIRTLIRGWSALLREEPPPETVGKETKFLHGKKVELLEDIHRVLHS